MNDITMILVEDDPMVLAVNEGFIQQIGGFQILASARTGRQAIELIKALTPRLVVLDLYLPDLDGSEVLMTIRQSGLPTDVIMITAAQDVQTVQELLRLGVIDYIIKPFRFERLQRALEKYKLFFNKLTQGEIAQEELDRLMNLSADKPKMGQTPTEEILPKGLRSLTLQQILKFLAEKQDGVSAEEVAVGLGLARVTARRYLEYLEKTGRVRLESRYGSIGRPVNRYRVRIP